MTSSTWWLNLLQVIVRGAHHFRAVQDIWPQNSKLKLLRSVIRANGGSSDVATAVRVCLPAMRRYISLAKSRRSARLAELNGSNHSAQAKVRARCRVLVLELLAVNRRPQKAQERFSVVVVVVAAVGTYPSSVKNRRGVAKSPRVLHLV